MSIEQKHQQLSVTGQSTELALNQEIKIARIIANIQLPKWRERNLTFWINANEETLRRANLPSLNPNFTYDQRGNVLPYLVRIDDEGRLYQPRWSETGKIKPDYKILGKSQSWRNYSENPPKRKLYQKLTFDYVRAGVDVALRRSTKITGKYRVESSGENREALQVLSVIDHLSKLRQEAMRLEELSEEDLQKIVDENAAFIADQGLLNPKSASKKHIRDLLLRGFLDKNGNKNFLTVYSRLFATELAVRKRLEGAFPPTLIKYSANSEILRFERDLTRKYLERVISDLENQSTLKDLRKLSYQMLNRVRVRPYSLVARVAIINFGLIDLPENTIAGKVQQTKRRLNKPTVADYIRAGDKDKARELLEQTRLMFQKVLDVHQNYLTVKPAKKTQMKLKGQEIS